MVCIVDCVIEFVVDLRQPETEHIVSHWPLKKASLPGRLKHKSLKPEKRMLKKKDSLVTIDRKSMSGTNNGLSDGEKSWNN